MQNNYESYEKNINDCAASGGTFSIQGCNIPEPVQVPSTYLAPILTQSGSCSSWMSQAGISDQATALQVVMIESGCNPNAVNASSGACGIGQQLPCGKWPHQWNDPVGALIDTQNYVFSSYGSWANALLHEHAYGWY